MERPHRPPPLTIPPPPRSRTRVRRPRRPNHRQARQYKRWLLRAQIANDVAHVAAASILLWIMSWFLYNVPFPLTYRTGPAAIALLAMLSADILLDARSIVHAHDPFPGWALLLRLLLGTGLIAIFAVYIALGDVFAPGFTYWAMTEAYGRVLVYMLLWGVGLWDVIFVLLYRRWLTKEIRRYGSVATAALGPRRRHRSSSSPTSRRGPESAHPLDTAERPSRFVPVDVEAARPVDDESGARSALPARMGVRRVKNGVSVSVDSFASSSTSPPPPLGIRPA